MRVKRVPMVNTSIRSTARDYKGAEMVPDGQAHLLIEIDGQKDSVRLESDALFRLLDSLGALSVAARSSAR